MVRKYFSSITLCLSVDFLNCNDEPLLQWAKRKGVHDVQSGINQEFYCIFSLYEIWKAERKDRQKHKLYMALILQILHMDGKTNKLREYKMKKYFPWFASGGKIKFSHIFVMQNRHYNLKCTKYTETHHIIHFTWRSWNEIPSEICNIEFDDAKALWGINALHWINVKVEI